MHFWTKIERTNERASERTNQGWPIWIQIDKIHLIVCWTLAFSRAFCFFFFHFNIPWMPKHVFFCGACSVRTQSKWECTKYTYNKQTEWILVVFDENWTKWDFFFFVLPIVIHQFVSYLYLFLYHHDYHHINKFAFCPFFPRVSGIPVEQFWSLLMSCFCNKYATAITS